MKSDSHSFTHQDSTPAEEEGGMGGEGVVGFGRLKSGAFDNPVIS